MKYKIIKTNDGYMVEQSDGDYLCDADGNNLFDWYHEADALIPKEQPLEVALALLDKATTLIYNMEGDTYQQAYEKLEEVINQLKGEVNAH